MCVYSAAFLRFLRRVCMYFAFFFRFCSNSWLAHEIHSSLHYFYILWKMYSANAIHFNKVSLDAAMNGIYFRDLWRRKDMRGKVLAWNQSYSLVSSASFLHFILCLGFARFGGIILNTSSCWDQWQPFNRSFFSRNRKEQHAHTHIHTYNII